MANPSIDGLLIETEGSVIKLTIEKDGETFIFLLCEHIARPMAHGLVEACAHMRHHGRACSIDHGVMQFEKGDH